MLIAEGRSRRHTRGLQYIFNSHMLMHPPGLSFCWIGNQFISFPYRCHLRLLMLDAYEGTKSSSFLWRSNAWSSYSCISQRWCQSDCVTASNVGVTSSYILSKWLLHTWVCRNVTVPVLHTPSDGDNSNVLVDEEVKAGIRRVLYVVHHWQCTQLRCHEIYSNRL